MATINIQELAETLETTPRTARKFLRSVTPADEQPGKGGRWNIEKRQVRSLKKQFQEFNTQPAADVPEDAIDTEDTPQPSAE